MKPLMVLLSDWTLTDTSIERVSRGVPSLKAWKKLQTRQDVRGTLGETVRVLLWETGQHTHWTGSSWIRGEEAKKTWNGTQEVSGTAFYSNTVYWTWGICPIQLEEGISREGFVVLYPCRTLSSNTHHHVCYSNCNVPFWLWKLVPYLI